MHQPAAEPIVILTGAGISKESGLDTFRCKGGLWDTVDLEDVATPEAFERDPETVQAFYNDRRRQLQDPEIQPNEAHRALARLEREWPAPVTLVTQNIDHLHERAGSASVIHMHGDLLKVRCEVCGGVCTWLDDVQTDSACPECGTPGHLRPNVVWFGEMPMEMGTILKALAECGTFLSIGTSGAVYPAAGFVQEARRHGARTVELNMEPSEGATLFQEHLYGPATEIVPGFVERLLQSL